MEEPISLVNNVTEAELAALVLAGGLHRGLQYRDTTNNKLYFATSNNTYIEFATPMKQIQGVVISAAGWVQDGNFKYQVNNENITAETSVDVISSNEDYLIVMAAEVLEETKAYDGYAIIEARVLPAADFTVTLNITKKSS